MTKDEKQRWFKAIDRVRLHYLRKEKLRTEDCPFCDIVTTEINKRICKNCLWMKYEGYDCKIVAIDKPWNMNIGHLRQASFSENCSRKAEIWRCKSLRRLDRWERKIKEEKCQ